jgi:hypothetical protein
MRAGGGGDARGRLSSTDARQFGNETRQLQEDLQDLRENLAGAGATREDLQSVDDVARALRALGGSLEGDPGELQALAAAALERIQKLELDLRRRVDTTSDQLFLSGSDEVPTRFQSLVDEYFRNLSRKGGTGGGGN